MALNVAESTKKCAIAAILSVETLPWVSEAGRSRVLCCFDAGDGYGEWRVDQFRMVRDENGLELTWEQQGDYALPSKSVQLHPHGLELQQAWVDGTEVDFQGNYIECAQFALIYINWAVSTYTLVGGEAKNP